MSSNNALGAVQRLIRWFKDHSLVYQWGFSLLALGLYGLAYALLTTSVRTAAGMLIILPVLVAVWMIGGQAWVILIAGVILQVVIGYQQGYTFDQLAFERGGLIGIAIIAVVMAILAHLRRITRGLRQQTAEQRVLLGEVNEQAGFLSLLGDIITASLAAADTQSILQVLVDRTGSLFGANACYITFWDEENRQTIPQVAYGSLSGTYQQVHQYQNGEYTLTAAVLDAGHAIAIEDIKHSTVISPKLAKEFPNISALGLPLTAGEKKLGSLILGFDKRRTFSSEVIARSELAARQISLAITKAMLLDEERRRTRQLDTLLALAIESTRAKSEDELVDSATRLIGEKLYPDNFGVMILDEPAGMLRVHASYQTPGFTSPDIPLNEGVTGYVARTRKPCRVPDVSKFKGYVSVDPAIRSELCVPLILGERLIGVVNAESIRLNAFDEDDEALLTIMAGQLATAMGRLRATDLSLLQARDLERANAIIRSLAEVGTRAAAATDPDQVLRTLGSELEKLNLLCLVLLLGAEGSDLTIRYTSIPQNLVRLAERWSHVALYEQHIPMELASEIIPPRQEPYIIDRPVDVSSRLMVGLPKKLIQRIFIPRGGSSESPVYILPLGMEGVLQGYLWLWGPGLHESDLPSMTIFAYQIASALQRASLLVKVQRLAVTDELTGLFNRRYFFDIAAKEFERAVTGKHPLSVLILDMDDFKQINDRYGHLVGDQVLRAAARLMQASVRSRDVIGRYGGEEFSILLPGADGKVATQVAKRFLAQVMQEPIPTQAGDIHISLSIGIASLTPEIHDLNELINHADKSMYRAKASGGNSFVVA